MGRIVESETFEAVRNGEGWKVVGEFGEELARCETKALAEYISRRMSLVGVLEDGFIRALDGTTVRLELLDGFTRARLGFRMTPGPWLQKIRKSRREKT